MKAVKKGKKKGKKKAGAPVDDMGDMLEDQEVNMAEPVDPKITQQPPNVAPIDNAQGPLKIEEPVPLKVPE